MCVVCVVCAQSQEKLCAGLKKLQWSDKSVIHEDNLPALGTVLRSVLDPLHVVWPAVAAAAHRSAAFSKFWTDIVCGRQSPTLCSALLRVLCTPPSRCAQMTSATVHLDTSVRPSTWCRSYSRILPHMKSTLSSLPVCSTASPVGLPAPRVLFTPPLTSW